jgi:lipopolysaccharide transport system ATP-binding protein
MEFDVLEPDHVLYPTFEIFNDEGLRVFDTIDSDPEWRARPRTPGRYASTAWIPGNFLSEGTLFVNAEIATYHPLVQHVLERDAVAFQVVDSLEGDSARGDWAGSMRGAVRPLLKWTTSVEVAADARAARAGAPRA